MPVVTDEGTVKGMHSQVAAVTTPLQSVRQLHRTGHIVVFDGNDSFSLSRYTGETTWIRYDGTNYLMGLWVIPRGELELMEGEATNGQGFPWPAK